MRIPNIPSELQETKQRKLDLIDQRKSILVLTEEQGGDITFIMRIQRGQIPSIDVQEVLRLRKRGQSRP